MLFRGRSSHQAKRGPSRHARAPEKAATLQPEASIATSLTHRPTEDGKFLGERRVCVNSPWLAQVIGPEEREVLCFRSVRSSSIKSAEWFWRGPL